MGRSKFFGSESTKLELINGKEKKSMWREILDDLLRFRDKSRAEWRRQRRSVK